MSVWHSPRPQYDAIVAGGRAAGAATALLLARRGLRVLVVDRGGYGSDTLSTHALMRGAVLQLHRWDLLSRVVAAGTPPIRTTSFHYGADVVTVRIKARDGVDALYAPRRTVLDRILVDGAREAGADVRHGVRLTGLERDAHGRVVAAVLAGAGPRQQRIEAGIVIGADGMRSTVAELVEAPIYRQGRHATAVLYAYWRGLAVDGYEWRYNPGVSTGVIPTNDGETCVFASMPGARFAAAQEAARAGGRGFDKARLYHAVVAECSPELSASLGAAAQSGAIHGFAGQFGYFRRSWGPGWALVGDAGYFKDPLTAHGITDALRDAELLASAVADGSPAALEAYERTRDGLAVTHFEVTDAVASFDWDLRSVQVLHRTMSEAMAAEVRAIRAFGEAIPPAAYGASVVTASASPVRQLA